MIFLSNKIYFYISIKSIKNIKIYYLKKISSIKLFSIFFKLKVLILNIPK
jgi:hypothetical protein